MALESNTRNGVNKKITTLANTISQQYREYNILLKKYDIILILKLINNKNRKSFKIHFLLAQDTKESNIYIIYYLHWHFKNPLHKKVPQIKSNKHKTWWNYNHNPNWH